ncbi:MAG: ribonuclease P protein subunit [Promethearchaeota archaeon]
MNPKYIIYHDLIGFNAYAKLIPKSRKIGFKNIGIVIDETKNMLITETNKKIKKYIKKDHIFRFEIPNSNDMLEVEGNKIVGDPINRLRNLKKRRRFRK